MLRCETLIIGSGIAATSAATRLQRIGCDFKLVIDENAVKHRPVWISGDGTADFPQTRIGMKTTQSVRMLSGNADFTIPHEEGKYWVIDPAKVINAIGGAINPEHKIPIDTKRKRLRVKKSRIGFKVTGLAEEIFATKIIDATGLEAGVDGTRIQQKDHLVESIFGASFRGHLQDREMILVFLPTGTCWIAESAFKDHIDIVTTAWGPRSRTQDFFRTAAQRLDRLVDFARRQKGIDIQSDQPQERYQGMISAQGFNHGVVDGVYPFGEAAQTTRPASQESFNRILTMGNNLVASIVFGLSTQDYLLELARHQRKDRYMYAGLLARILAYDPSKPSGTVINGVHRVIEKLPSQDRKQEMKSRLEEWVQYGEVDTQFILKLAARDGDLCKSLIYSGCAHLMVSILGSEKTLSFIKAVNDHIAGKGYFNN